jgi:hypothetical protein
MLFLRAGTNRIEVWLGIVNRKGFRRKRSWPNEGSILEFSKSN